MKFRNFVKAALLVGAVYALYKLDPTGDLHDLKQSLEDELGDIDDDHLCGMPNPICELSPESFALASGTDLELSKIQELRPRAYSINSEPEVFGLELTDSDFLKYDFRFTDKSFDADITGMYYTWDQEYDYPQDAPVCKVRLTNSGQGICTWEDDVRKYALSMSEGASLVKLVWMRERISKEL